ncbi:hypothetical protein RRG08_030187 [Elysia crispata]|uniref:Uncharacterized protein n=1 Tax=Elysia crispata TaxID=231223 RepID=A0AAE1DLD5_9GAST|nr:hypothetical protein RRG08_030187 [Elysia crispata]
MSPTRLVPGALDKIVQRGKLGGRGRKSRQTMISCSLPQNIMRLGEYSFRCPPQRVSVVKTGNHWLLLWSSIKAQAKTK